MAMLVTAVGIVYECTATDRNIAFAVGVVKERVPSTAVLLLPVA